MREGETKETIRDETMGHRREEEEEQEKVRVVVVVCVSRRAARYFDSAFEPSAIQRRQCSSRPAHIINAGKRCCTKGVARLLFLYAESCYALFLRCCALVRSCTQKNGYYACPRGSLSALSDGDINKQEYRSKWPPRSLFRGFLDKFYAYKRDRTCEQGILLYFRSVQKYRPEAMQLA